MKQPTTINIQKARIHLSSYQALETPQASVNVAQPIPSAVPKIGRPWPGQGGAYAGVMRGHDNNDDYHLILVTKHPLFNKRYAWHDPDSRVAMNDDGKNYSDGARNTALLQKSDAIHPAAEIVAQLHIDGFSDFYLPSRNEAALLSLNVIYLIPPDHYWTSSQESATQAYTFGTFPFCIEAREKTEKLPIIAVRRIPINHPSNG